MVGTGLKALAREIMLKVMPGIFLIGAIYIVFTTILSTLSVKLAGLDFMLEQFQERIAEGEPVSFSLIFPDFKPLGGVLVLLVTIFVPVLDVGFLACCLKASRGKTPHYKELFDGFFHFGKIILLSIIKGALIAAGFALLIVPGVIFMLVYSQAFYILLDDPKKGVIECMRESRRLMRGNKLDLFLLRLSFIGWHMLNFIAAGYIPFGLPLVAFWLTPYTGLTYAGFYNYLISYDLDNE